MCFTKLKAALRGLMAMALAAVSTSALADYELNMPKGVTELSGEVYQVHMLVFWICVGIGVVVFGLMIYSIFAHRKSKHPVPAKFHHNTTVEVIWTVIPFIILIVMAVPAAQTLIKMEDFRKSDISIKVTALQWKWRYDYLLKAEDGADVGFGFYSTLDEESNRIRQVGSGLNPADKENYLLDVDNEVVVPVGKKVRVLLTSADVIHAWWVPEFASKKDAIPGYINELWFRVTEPGVYRGQCAELCGRDHGFMPIVVRAVPEAEYNEWVASQQQKYGVTAPRGMMDAAAAEKLAAPQEWNMETAMQQGEQVYATSCQSCHMANGEGMPAAGFPALKGGAIATGEIPAHLDIVIHGSKKNPAMAAWGSMLSDEEIAAVVTYERNAWGNNTGDLIKPSDVKAAR